VLVHNHVLLRQGIRRLLEDEPDLEVVAEAGNAEEAVQGVFEHRPAVVLADARTLGLPMRDAERVLQRASPVSRVLFLNAPEPEESAPNAQRAGRDGCARRQTSAEELVRMVRSAGRHQKHGVYEISGQARGEPEASPPRKRGLTAREHEVLKLLAEGKTVRSVAHILGLSMKTVDAHKFNLMRKLGIHNKAELVMWAIQKHVVKIPVNF
jgi:two-component system response regulator NreC